MIDDAQRESGQRQQRHTTSKQAHADIRIQVRGKSSSPSVWSDLAGSQLPKQFGPWRAIGAIAPDRSPPHNLSRDVIEAVIKEQGFQLWRLSKRD